MTARARRPATTETDKTLLAEGLAAERTAARQQAQATAVAAIADTPGTRWGQRHPCRSRAGRCRAPARHAGLPKPPGKPRKTSDALAEDWRKGGYPYAFKMLRRDYEQEKFQLQTELLKLQSWGEGNPPACRHPV